MTAPGDVVGGRYVLRGLLARGGMADVYRAHDVVGNRPVAVKAFRGEPSTDTDALRFEREAQLLAELDHPNLVELLDAGHHDEAPYLVLELVNGPTLSQRLGDGPLAPDEARQIGCDVARALAYVHAQGVVHRDVKPSNILLHSDGRALLSDFGIAQSADGTRLTAAQTTIGTAAYLAPEQIGGQPVTGAADVYSLGLVLVESLAGRRPFQGTQHEIVAARLASDPRIPPTLPPAWEQLVQAMTRRDPAARPEAALIAEHLATALGAAPSLVDDLDDLPTTPALPDESGQTPPGGPIALPGPPDATPPGPSTAALPSQPEAALAGTSSAALPGPPDAVQPGLSTGAIPGEPKGALASPRLAAMSGQPEAAVPDRSTAARAGRPEAALAHPSRAGMGGQPEAGLAGQATAAMPSRAEAALPGQDTAAMPGELAAALVGHSGGGVRDKAGASDPRGRERGRSRRRATAAPSRPVPSPGWLAVLAAAAVLAVVFLFVTRGGGTPRPDTARAESSDTTATPSSTAIAVTAAPPAAGPAPPIAAATEQSPPAQETASLTATCADLDAQKQALNDQKHQIDETYRHDRETRQALRDDLDTQKQALDDQKQALGC